jgi:poly(hydroxyalkanoate) depolymerase family esterase
MELDRRFLAQMREATEILQRSGPAAATAVIQRGLQGASGVAPAGAEKKPVWSSSIVQPAALETPWRFREPSWRPSSKDSAARQAPDAREVDAVVDELDGKGQFLTASCTNPAGTRSYKLYVPSGYRGQALPLIVMLHGCKQNPDDFAAGTGMNAIAEQNDCFVVYPAQARAANGSNCWNWFKTSDQQRDRGEPSIIADITREVMREYDIDPSRVYVAGLSAGGAMAAIMGATYPELYAAVGIHSGLPVGAAHDLPSAFAAMKNGTARGGSRRARGTPIPVIVFHGDRDTTVHPGNGEQALAQCVDPDDHDVTVEEGRVPHGHAYTRSVRRDRSGSVIAEQWIVHGAGHAWSGGDRSGSYTDPRGPNAAREMMRFFTAHARSAT